MSDTAFDFGSNWLEFSRERLTPERVEAATASLRDLLHVSSLDGIRFADVGCGSGLFSIAALRLGATLAAGFDINPTSVQAAELNAAQHVTAALRPRLQFKVGSILDDAWVGAQGRYELVYAWGSLHHTGAMWHAIENTFRLVAPGGTLVLAIYNRHWSSPAWRAIKHAYNLASRPVRRVMVEVLGAVIWLAKLIVTRRNPLRKERGMDFRTDVVDWVGGYPYEFAAPSEIQSFAARHGFRVVGMVAPATPTGCNEFVLRAAASAPQTS